MDTCTKVIQDQKEEIDKLRDQKWDLILVDTLFAPCGIYLSEYNRLNVNLHTNTVIEILYSLHFYSTIRQECLCTRRFWRI